MCELKALRDSNPSDCQGALWQGNVDPGEDLCPAVSVKTRVCGGFSFSRAHKTSLKSIIFCICHERDCPLTSRDWDHLERLVRCVTSIPLWGHFCGVTLLVHERETRASPSRASVLSCAHYFQVLPWMPESFLARFPVSVKSLKRPVASAFGHRTREKPLVPRVSKCLLRQFFLRETPWGRGCLIRRLKYNELLRVWSLPRNLGALKITVSFRVELGMMGLQGKG